MPTRDEIATAISRAVGDPDAGVVKDVLPAITDAVMNVIAPAPEGTGGKAKRVIEADETR